MDFSNSGQERSGGSGNAPDAWVDQFQNLYDAGRLDEALAFCGKAIAGDFEGDHRVWFCRGNALYGLGMPEAALESYDKALEINPQYEVAWYNRGNALSDLGMPEAALESYDKALEINPQFDAAWYNRGNALSDLGMPEAAVKSYDNALEINPKNDVAWFNRGVALQALGMPEAAVASYDKALEINPQNHVAWLNRGGVLEALGMPEAAVASFDKALEINPQYDAAWFNRGVALQALGMREAALASYDKALEINPQYDAAWLNRGIALQALGMREAAVASFDKALEINPQYDAAWYNRGVALQALGRLDESLQSVNQAIALNAAEGGYWILKALVLEKTGDHEACLQSMHRATSLPISHTLQADLRHLLPILSEKIHAPFLAAKIFTKHPYFATTLKWFDFAQEVNKRCGMWNNFLEYLDSPSCPLEEPSRLKMSGMVCLYLGDPENGEKFFDALDDTCPEDLSGQYYLCQCMETLMQDSGAALNDAMDQVKAWLDLPGKQQKPVQAYYGGMIARMADDLPLAIRLFGMAENFLPAHYMAAQTQHELGNTVKRDKRFKDILALERIAGPDKGYLNPPSLVGACVTDDPDYIPENSHVINIGRSDWDQVFERLVHGSEIVDAIMLFSQSPEAARHMEGVNQAFYVHDKKRFAKTQAISAQELGESVAPFIKAYQSVTVARKIKPYKEAISQVFDLGTLTRKKHTENARKIGQWIAHRHKEGRNASNPELVKWLVSYCHLEKLISNEQAALLLLYGQLLETPFKKGISMGTNAFINSAMAGLGGTSVPYLLPKMGISLGIGSLEMILGGMAGAGIGGLIGYLFTKNQASLASPRPSYQEFCNHLREYAAQKNLSLSDPFWDEL